MAEVWCVYGLRTDVSNNVLMVDEQTIVYLYGTNCIFYNVDQKHQKYMQVLEKKTTISTTALSPNKRYLALAERGNIDKGEKPSIAIYDMSVFRKRKVLLNQDSTQCKEYVSLSFSSDSKLIAALLSHPDSVLQIWMWEKSKISATIVVSASQQIPILVFQASFNPQDDTMLSVTGQGYVKFYKYSDAGLKQLASHKLDNVDYYSQAWLEDHLVVGSEHGKLMFFSGTLFKHELDVSVILEQQQVERNEEEEPSDQIKSRDEIKVNKESISNLTPYSKGFIFCYGQESVHVFERIDNFNYKASKEIKIPENISKVLKTDKHLIQSLCISPNEETVICSTSRNHIFSAHLHSSEIDRVEEGNFELLCHPFHSKQVVAIDICPRKSIVASCSQDGQVKIWNFEKRTLELSVDFLEEAHSLSLHPFGHHVVVSFTNKLRFMSILIDDLKVLKEIPLKSCHKCCFSNGGHLIAAVNGNVICIFSSTTFETVSNLKGHAGKIKGLTWSKDDARLVSCSNDGVIYEWNVMTGNRNGEVVTKSCNYHDITMSSDGKSVFVVGSDMMLKEIVDSQIVRTLDVGDKCITSVSVSGKSLVIGTTSGLLRLFTFPLVSSSESLDRLLHVDAITGIQISHDEQYIITSSMDGGVVVWKLHEEYVGSKLKKDVIQTDEILISKSDLNEKNAIMGDLKMRVEELKLENEYHMRVQDTNFKEKINELTETFVQELDSLRSKNQALRIEKEKILKRTEEQVKEIHADHASLLQDIESRNNQKLMMEYEKYQELQNRSQKMQDEYENKMSAAVEERQREVSSIKEVYEEKIRLLNETIKQVNEEFERKNQEQEEMIHQTEEDADLEVLLTKNQLQKKLRDEMETCDKLRNQVGVMSKAFVSMKKEIGDGKEEVRKGHIEVQKMEQMILNLEKDIKAFKKEIQERDNTIQDKEKRIQELKKINQELEKFKFVLDFNIVELKSQIEPKEKRIESMEDQIEQMEEELGRYHQLSSQMELKLASMKKKLSASEKTLLEERQKVHCLNIKIERIKTDIQQSMTHIQDPKQLKSTIMAIHKKHVQDIANEPLKNDEQHNDFAKQREFLEKSMASLIKKNKRDSDLHKAENMCILQHNVKLIREVNDLRQELKCAQSKIRNHESFSYIVSHKRAHTLSSPSKKSIPSNDAWVNANDTTSEMELREKNKLVELQHEEILKLRHLLQGYETSIKASPIQKLSPISSDQ